MITAVTIFLCLFQIITLAKGTCDVYPVIRSPCDFQRPIVDEATCLKRLCCFDGSPGISINVRCYKRGLDLGSARFKPTGPPELHNEATQLEIGGSDGYPGSILRRTCTKTAPVCKTSASYDSKASCTRMSCCWIDGACYKAIFNVIRLRDKCEPGYANPPQCKEINECESNSCTKNREVCVDKVNAYECQCPPGETCEQNCDSITTSDTYDVVYNTDFVLYSDPIPSGKQLPRTKATITCKDGLFFPYSFTNTLTITNSLTYTCSSGTFGVTAPVCKKRCSPAFLNAGSINWPTAGLPMVVEGQSISYSCDLGFEMDAGADNQLDCQSGGTLSGTLSSKNIQCNEIYKLQPAYTLGYLDPYSDAYNLCENGYGSLMQNDVRLTTLEGRKSIYTWNYPGTYLLNIYRDDDGVTWRREKDDSVFPIADADWYPGYPDPASDKGWLAIKFAPSDPFHGRFVNRAIADQWTIMLFLCETLNTL